MSIFAISFTPLNDIIAVRQYNQPNKEVCQMKADRNVYPDDIRRDISEFENTTIAFFAGRDYTTRRLTYGRSEQPYVHLR